MEEFDHREKPAPNPVDTGNKGLFDPDDAVTRRIIDSLPVAIFGKDASDAFRFVVWNKKQTELTGITRDQAIGKTDFDIFPTDEAEGFRKADLGAIEHGEPVEIPEERIDSPINGVIWLKTLKTTVQDSRKNRRWLLGISEDITAQKTAADKLHRTAEELKATQLQLIQAEKMESIGRLAAGVAHEVKNPLSHISMGLDYLKGGVKSDDPNLPVVVGEMSDALERANSIVQGLLDFSGNRSLDLVGSDLASVVDRGLRLVRYEIARSKVQVDIAVGDDLPEVLLDSSKFEQVLVNVFTNALHAMEACDIQESAHRIEISLENATVDFETPEEGERGCRRLKSGEKAVALRVTDTGCGFPKADAEKAFDPFFTTKKTGDGTGLGLSVVQKIIILHGGHISLGPRKDSLRGAEVLILLRPVCITKN